MTALEFKLALELLGMSQAAAARFLRQSSRQTARMANGEVPVPAPIAMLLRSMIFHGETPGVPPRLAKQY